MTNGASSVDERERTHILRVERTERALTLDWGDGHRSLLHYIWLRDNCECHECGSEYSDIGTGSRKKYLNLLAIPEDVRPVSAELDEHNQLRIVWHPNHHRSMYPAAWLRDHCYSPEERQRRRHQPVLWTGALSSQKPAMDYREIIEEIGLLRMLELVRDYGFVLVHGVPIRLNEVEKVGALVGRLKENNYGRVFDVVAGVGPEIGATNRYELPPHTDDPFRYTPPGLTLFHCLKASAHGGETQLVDAFKIAEVLRELEPNSFDILSRLPQNFHRYHLDEMDLRADARAIATDFEGRVMGVRFDNHTYAPLDLPAQYVERYYAALRRFMALGVDPDYRLQFRLEPGDMLVYDNQRVMHGRTAFEGDRHLQLAHLDREEFHSRLHVLGRRFGRDDVQHILAQGALG